LGPCALQLIEVFLSLHNLRRVVVIANRNGVLSAGWMIREMTGLNGHDLRAQAGAK
jgi:hypothetical protein